MERRKEIGNTLGMKTQLKQTLDELKMLHVFPGVHLMFSK